MPWLLGAEQVKAIMSWQPSNLDHMFGDADVKRHWLTIDVFYADLITDKAGVRPKQLCEYATKGLQLRLWCRGRYVIGTENLIPHGNGFVIKLDKYDYDRNLQEDMVDWFGFKQGRFFQPNLWLPYSGFRCLHCCNKVYDDRCLKGCFERGVMMSKVLMRKHIPGELSVIVLCYL